MAFNGTEGGAIDQNTAGKWTRNYREQSQSSTLGHFFGKDILRTLLDQDGSMGIRFYYALDGAGNKQLVAAAVTADENDMVGDAFKVADEASPSPPYSGMPNILNS
jgi:hypothetical protein